MKKKSKKESLHLVKKLEERADMGLMKFLKDKFDPLLEVLKNVTLSEKGLQLLQTSNLRNVAEIIQIIVIEDLFDQKKITWRVREIDTFLKEHKRVVECFKEMEE